MSHPPVIPQAVMHHPDPDPPTVQSVSPASGPTTGGNAVAVTGTNFTGATAVRFGERASPAFTVNSATRITAIAPQGSGTVQVTVTTPAGTSNGLPYGYVTVAPPKVTHVSPDQGPSSGGNTVTITGTALSGATAVTFGGIPSSSFTVTSDQRLTAVVPPDGTGPVDVIVTTPAGASAPGVLYYYVAAPVLVAVLPGAGPAGGGNTVTITGSGLIETSQVRFGDAPAASFTVLSDERITATVPPGVPGAAELTVVTPGGTSNALHYLYLDAPQVSALQPDAGPATGGNSVTLSGSGLGRATEVLFGTLPAPFTIVSDTHVVATAPPGAPGPVGVVLSTPGGTTSPLTYTRLAGPEI
ncbi:IPT/TIG domain-containing protein [Streptomyces sp. 6N223]|uniref:IPT/TIG domain-containing protein n=1 Tax=Streptomyces sp. 6N223 TaxID=3457412 RepID=UPI003FCF3230